MCGGADTCGAASTANRRVYMYEKKGGQWGDMKTTGLPKYLRCIPSRLRNKAESEQALGSDSADE